MSGRAFSPWQAMRIKQLANGRCRLCCRELLPDWHADHIIPWSLGGLTVVSNGQALCSSCNQQKGDKMPDRQLRPVQIKALDAIEKNREAGIKLTVLHYGVGSGKTLIELADAYRRWVTHGEKALFVVPTMNLRDQVEQDYKSWRPHLQGWFGVADAGIRAYPDSSRESLPDHRMPFGVLTYTLLTSSKDGQRAFFDWAMTNDGRYNLYGDEAQFLGIDDKDNGLFAKAFARLHDGASHTVLLTGTPERADRRPLVLCQDAGKYSYRPTSDGGTERMLHADERAVYYELLNFEHLVAFEGESLPAERPIIVTETYRENGHQKQERMEYDTIDAAVDAGVSYSNLMRKEEVWRPIVDRAISRFLGLRDIYRAVGVDPALLIIGVDQDTCKEIKNYVDNRSGDGLLTRLALSDLPQSRETLREFRQEGSGNVLITCQMAYVGFDHPPIKVIAYCGGALTEERLIQTFGRSARVVVDKSTNQPVIPHGDQYCYWYGPQTSRMDGFIERLKDISARWRREKKPGPPPPPPGPGKDFEISSVGMQLHGEVTAYAKADLPIQLQQSAVRMVEQYALDLGLPVSKAWQFYEKMQGSPQTGSEKTAQDVATESTVDDDGGAMTSRDRKNANQNIKRRAFHLLHQVFGDDRHLISKEYARARGSWNERHGKIDDLVTNGEAQRYEEAFLAELKAQL